MKTFLCFGYSSWAKGDNTLGYFIGTQEYRKLFFGIWKKVKQRTDELVCSLEKSKEE